MHLTGRLSSGFPSLVTKYILKILFPVYNGGISHMETQYSFELVEVINADHDTCDKYLREAMPDFIISYPGLIEFGLYIMQKLGHQE